MIARRLAAAVTSGVAAAWLATGGCGAERHVPPAAQSAAVEPATGDEPLPTTPETPGARGPAAEVVATAAARTGAQPTAPAEQTSTPLPGCDVNYSPCVPRASDVDCDRLGQDGPRFVAGPIRITGVDVYQLDGAERDGVACQGSGSGW